MNWLLHQLQKVLGALSGRRSNSRPLTSDQDAPDAAASKKSDRAISDQATSPQAGISFSIQPSTPSVQPPTDSQKDTIQKVIERADGVADTHMRLDAASSAIPESHLGPSDSEAVTPSDQLISDESIADIQSANQLPSIHDLLPAVEQEIKANSTHFDGDESLDNPDLDRADSLSLELENYDTENEVDTDETAEPLQALLFSFDITESTTDEGNIVEDENVNEPIQPASSLIEPVYEESVSETAIAPSLVEESDNTDDSMLVDDSVTELDADTHESDATVFDRASLPYPWSIATPKKTAASEDKPSLQQEEEEKQEEEKQTSLQIEGDIAIEPETAHVSSPNSVAAQPIQETNYTTKNGVVKLLFTLKEGNFHGYIEPKDGTSDILFHQKYINEDIFDSLERGVEVVVSVEYKAGKAYATQVELA